MNHLAFVDVLCIGHASYDLVFSITHHPNANEKMFANSLLGCGGGPAANAAITIAKLGYQAGFCGYLGKDVYGDSHLQELQQHGVATELVIRGHSPTPLSTVLVKPNGQRALINYKGDTHALATDSLDFSGLNARVVLFDGHEPHISLKLLSQLKTRAIPSVLDAGSVHDGTLALLDKLDYLVCSEKFALQYAGSTQQALQQLAALAPAVVITLGEHGLIWQRGGEIGQLPAPPVVAIDTTGAGDVFHGAFAAGLAADLPWQELLSYASAAGGLCCTGLGARPSIPSREQHQQLLASWLI